MLTDKETLKVIFWLLADKIWLKDDGLTFLSLGKLIDCKYAAAAKEEANISSCKEEEYFKI